MGLISCDVFAEERKSRSNKVNLEIDTEVAISIILNIPVSHVFWLIREQIPIDGTQVSEFSLPDTEQVVKAMQKQAYQHYIVYDSLRLTPKQFIKANPKGKFIIAGDTYCLAIINSDVYIGAHRPFKWFWWHKIRNKPITSIYAYNEITLLVEKSKVDIAFANKKVD